ncbi:MAG: SemiSWEET transporter [Acidobacteria bacterium]|nr:SemiSWEET transporter [Acidobacteriota bacterium]
MSKVEWLGILAGTLTTISFVPQVWRIWRRKSAEDVSLGMFSLFATGVLAWLGYGILIRATPIIVANVVTLILALWVIVLKLRYRMFRQLRAAEPSSSIDQTSSARSRRRAPR